VQGAIPRTIMFAYVKGMWNMAGFPKQHMIYGKAILSETVDLPASGPSLAGDQKGL